MGLMSFRHRDGWVRSLGPDDPSTVWAIEMEGRVFARARVSSREAGLLGVR